MKLNFDKKSLEISSRKVISGIISIEVYDGNFFPEESWNDSIVIVLSSWLQNASSFLEKASTVTFAFFDGPFSFTISRKEGLDIIELFRNAKSLQTYNTDFKEFAYELIKASKSVLKEINTRGWESDDIDQLESSLKSCLILM